MKDKKILILHDIFLYKGGGERLILMMGKILKADIASGFFSSGSFDLRKEGFTGEMISLSSEVFTKGLRHIKLKWVFLTKTKFIDTYESVIFSGDSISAVRNAGPHTKKIYYCHTPPRYLYDLHELYLEKVAWYIRPVFRLGCNIFRYLYERDIAKMDIILTNSKNTQARIKKFLNLESHVLYPPVEQEKFKYLGNEDYFLSFARLADAKRVDKIVQAFQKLPQEQLIVIYGENDPQRYKIFELAQGYPNITLITLKDNNLLYEYIGKARATIYIPIDEDFGMSPVESMAAGKPVIGVDDGGLKETILDKMTGYMISKTAKIEDIEKAVQYMTSEKAMSMKDACQKRADDFGIESFETALKEIV